MQEVLLGHFVVVPAINKARIETVAIARSFFLIMLNLQVKLTYVFLILFNHGEVQKLLTGLT